MRGAEHRLPRWRPARRRVWIWFWLALALTLAVIGSIRVGPRLAERWHDRQPTLTSLRPSATAPIDAEPARYAALADLSPALMGEGRVEVLGNPAANRYPDCAFSVARNPWDLIAVDGRLYIGLGDDSNESPSINAGPVPIILFDPADGAFRREATLPEEQLDRFYRQGSALFVPGTDPRQSWRWGNLYRRDEGGGWRQFRTLPHSIHNHALAWHDGRLVAGLSITEAVPEGIGTERYGSAVAVSDDGALTWRLVPLGGWRIFDFLQVGGRLYATDIFPGPGIQRWLDREQRQAYHAPVYELMLPNPEGKIELRRRRDLAAAALFPETPVAGQRAAIVERALAWGDGAAYLGAFARWDDPRPVRGAYLADNLTEGAVRVRRVPLPTDALAFDLRLQGDALQVLFAQPMTANRWRNRVWSSPDGRHWQPLLSFTANGPARAFERLGDALYVGLGALQPPAAGTCTPTDRLSGTLLRWRIEAAD